MSDDLIAKLRHGCILHAPRWSGDTHADLGGSIKETETDALMREAADRIEELEAALQQQGEGSWIAADDVNRLVRELDVALNGEEGAAKQASLCDVVAQVKKFVRVQGRPVFTVFTNTGDSEAAFIADGEHLSKDDTQQQGEAATPAARWRVNGEPDPHAAMYDGERSSLAGGDMTDDEVANAVYIDPSIVNLTIAKERIRWLSRKLFTHPPEHDGKAVAPFGYCIDFDPEAHESAHTFYYLAPSEVAPEGCTLFYTHPPKPVVSDAVDWKDLYRLQTAMRYMDNMPNLTKERAFVMADQDITALAQLSKEPT